MSQPEGSAPAEMKAAKRLRSSAGALLSILAIILTGTGVSAPVLAASELKLFGTIHTDSVRTKASFLIRDANRALRVEPRNLRRGLEHREPWWREENAVLLLERSMGDTWLAAFERDRGRPPVALPVAASAVAVVVNGRNPVVERGIRVEDLERLVSASAEAQPEVSFWGQLGAHGEWKMRPVSVVFSHDGQAMDLFRDYVIGDAAMDWNVGQIPGGTGALIEAVERDGNALGITLFEAPMRTVGMVPVSSASDAPAVPPTAENIRAGRYPLAGCVHLYLDRAPGESLDDAEAAVARFLLSDEGQRLFAENGYVALGGASLKRARSWLLAGGKAASAKATPRCEVASGNGAS